MTRKNLFIGGAVVVVLAALAGAYFFFDRTSAPVPEPVENGTSTSTPGYTIEEVPLTDYPDLDRKPVFGPTVPAEARIAYTGSITATQARLKADATRGADWYNLGLLYNEANDHQGAREIWEFLIKASPKDTVAYNNLGKLYSLSLKDFPKAEMYFKQAISVNPDDLTAYEELHSLYRYSYKTDTSAAVDIIVAAEKRYPENPDLPTTLGAYYHAKGDTAKARVEYEKGMALARAAGDLDKVAAIGAVLASLPK